MDKSAKKVVIVSPEPVRPGPAKIEDDTNPSKAEASAAATTPLIATPAGYNMMKKANEVVYRRAAALRCSLLHVMALYYTALDDEWPQPDNNNEALAALSCVDTEEGDNQDLEDTDTEEAALHDIDDFNWGRIEHLQVLVAMLDTRFMIPAPRLGLPLHATRPTTLDLARRANSLPLPAAWLGANPACPVARVKDHPRDQGAASMESRPEESTSGKPPPSVVPQKPPKTPPRSLLAPALRQPIQKEAKERGTTQRKSQAHPAYLDVPGPDCYNCGGRGHYRRACPSQDVHQPIPASSSWNEPPEGYRFQGRARRRPSQLKDHCFHGVTPIVPPSPDRDDDAEDWGEQADRERAAEARHFRSRPQASRKPWSPEY